MSSGEREGAAARHAARQPQQLAPQQLWLLLARKFPWDTGGTEEVNTPFSCRRRHGKNLNSDGWRRLQLWRSTAAPGHPFSRFSTGNLETLLHVPTAAGRRPHEAVRAFHAKHYSAGVMKVAVVGPQGLDQLEALVRDKFAAVVDTGAAAPRFSVS